MHAHLSYVYSDRKSTKNCLYSNGASVCGQILTGPLEKNDISRRGNTHRIVSIPYNRHACLMIGAVHAYFFAYEMYAARMQLHDIISVVYSY